MANVPKSQVETAKDREEVDKLHALVVSFLARVQYNSYLDLDTTLSGVIVRGRRGTARILDPHNPNVSLACQQTLTCWRLGFSRLSWRAVARPSSLCPMILFTQADNINGAIRDSQQ